MRLASGLGGLCGRGRRRFRIFIGIRVLVVAVVSPGGLGSGRGSSRSSGLLVIAVIIIRLGSGRGFGGLRGGGGGLGLSRITSVGKCRNLGTGESVLETIVKDLGSENSLVVSSVSAGEADSLRGSGFGATGAARDAELEAARVEFRTTLAVGQVKGNNLMTHDIVAVFELLGDRDSVLGAKFHCTKSVEATKQRNLHTETCNEPPISILTFLGNLEKVTLGRIKLVCSLPSRDLGHVGNKRAHFMRPLLVRVGNPGQVELGTSGGGGNDSGELGTFTAGNAGALWVLVWVDGRDATDRRLGIGLARDGAIIGLAVDNDFWEILTTVNI